MIAPNGLCSGHLTFQKHPVKMSYLWAGSSLTNSYCHLRLPRCLTFRQNPVRMPHLLAGSYLLSVFAKGSHLSAAHKSISSLGCTPYMCVNIQASRRICRVSGFLHLLPPTCLCMFTIITYLYALSQTSQDNTMTLSYIILLEHSVSLFLALVLHWDCWLVVITHIIMYILYHIESVKPEIASACSFQCVHIYIYIYIYIYMRIFMSIHIPVNSL